MQELQLTFPRYLIKINSPLENKLVHIEIRERIRRKRKKKKILRGDQNWKGFRTTIRGGEC